MASGKTEKTQKLNLNLNQQSALKTA